MLSPLALDAPPATDTAPPAVVLDRIVHRFGARRALDELSLRVPTGQVTVLLGPNGAGKTTAIRVITGAMSTDSGSVRTLGLDPTVDGETIRRRCGVVAAKPALYDRLSGRDNLAYSAALYGLDPKTAPIESAAERFGIVAALDRQVGGYSTGMKTRLALSRAVLHDPDLLLLDEPTSGLDPESSIAVLGLIRDLTAHGKTVLLCTHLLLEAEGLADQVVIIEGGRDLIAGKPAALAKRLFPTRKVRLAAEDGASLDALGRLPGVRSIEREPDGAIIAELDEGVAVADLVDALVRSGARINRVEPREPSLEDLYFAVRGVRRGAMTDVTGARQ